MTDEEAAREAVAQVWREKEFPTWMISDLLDGLVTTECDDLVYTLAGIKRGRELEREGGGR